MSRHHLFAALVLPLALAPGVAAATSSGTLLTHNELPQPAATSRAVLDSRISATGVTTLVHVMTEDKSLTADNFNADVQAYVLKESAANVLPKTLVSGKNLAPHVVLDVIDPALHKAGFYYGSGISGDLDAESITQAALPAARMSDWSAAFRAMDDTAFPAPQSASASSAASPQSSHSDDTPVTAVAVAFLLCALAGVSAFAWSCIKPLRDRRQERERQAQRKAELEADYARADSQPRPDIEGLRTARKALSDSLPPMSPTLRIQLTERAMPKSITTFLSNPHARYLSENLDILNREASAFIADPVRYRGTVISDIRDDKRMKRAHQRTIDDLEKLTVTPAGALDLDAQVHEVCDAARAKVDELYREYQAQSGQTKTVPDYVDAFEVEYRTAQSLVHSAVKKYVKTPAGRALTKSGPSRSYGSSSSQTSADAMMWAMLAESNASSYHSSYSGGSSYSGSDYSSSSFDSGSSSSGFDGGSSSW